jgi:hypothetical protein
MVIDEAGNFDGIWEFDNDDCSSGREEKRGLFGVNGKVVKRIMSSGGVLLLHIV